MLPAEQPILDLFIPPGRTTTSIVGSAPVPLRPLPVPLRPLPVPVDSPVTGGPTIAARKARRKGEPVS